MRGGRRRRRGFERERRMVGEGRGRRTSGCKMRCGERRNEWQKWKVSLPPSYPSRSPSLLPPLFLTLSLPHSHPRLNQFLHTLCLHPLPPVHPTRAPLPSSTPDFPTPPSLTDNMSTPPSQANCLVRLILSLNQSVQPRLPAPFRPPPSFALVRTPPSLHPPPASLRSQA